MRRAWPDNCLGPSGAGTQPKTIAVPVMDLPRTEQWTNFFGDIINANLPVLCRRAASAIAVAMVPTLLIWMRMTALDAHRRLAQKRRHAEKVCLI